MKPQSLLLSIATLILTTSLSFGSPETDAARKQAQQCCDATVKKDYDKVIAFTHPNLIKMAGGKEAIRKALEAGMKEVAEAGVSIETAVVRSAAEPKKVGKALVSLISQEVILRTSDGKLSQESTLIGYSYDQGKNWVFADTGGIDEATFQKLFPDLKGVISLPSKKDPVPIKDK